MEKTETGKSAEENILSVNRENFKFKVILLINIAFILGLHGYPKCRTKSTEMCT